MRRFPLNLRLLLLLVVAVSQCNGGIHHWVMMEDTRHTIPLSQFGFIQDGWLNVNLTNISVQPVNMKYDTTLDHVHIGLTLTRGDELGELEQESMRAQQKCALNSLPRDESDVVHMNFDLVTGGVTLLRHGARLANLPICTTNDDGKCLVDLARRRRRTTSETADETADFFDSPEVRKEGDMKGEKGKGENSKGENSKGENAKQKMVTKKPPKSKTDPPPKSNNATITSTVTKKPKTKIVKPSKKLKSTPDSSTDLQTEVIQRLPNEPDRSEFLPKVGRKRLQMTRAKDGKSWNLQFLVRFLTPVEEGFYVLIFHNCYNYRRYHTERMTVSMEVDITERNKDTFLQAGDSVKPKFYFIMSCVYLIAALVWLSTVHSKSDTEVHRIHHIMSAVIVLKTLSLFFHGVNYYFMGKYGHQQEFWAVIYYITHLLKGSLLFGAIVLIGTGYSFFKNYLTERDRKLFMFILPLQVLDNVALIIVSETELGAQSHLFWQQLFILIDLVCCMAVIFPIIWSIRHLTEASQTDGKAAFNLSKLKLFRQFYVIMICFIYTTRVLKFTVPFKHLWLIELVAELGTLLFFVMTGSKFRPMKNNPYLKVASDDEEVQMDDIVGQSGALSGVKRVRRSGKNADLERQLLRESSSSDDDNTEGQNVIFESQMLKGTKRGAQNIMTEL